MISMLRHVRFHDPMALWLLLPLAALLLWDYRSPMRRAVLFSSLGPLRAFPKTLTQRLLPWVKGLIYAGLALLIIALARPQSGQEDYRVRSEGIAMAICLDRSGSMQAMDFQLDGKRVDRFVVVKKIFRDFVLGTDGFSGRSDDRIALLAFGGYVDALCPLTLDHDALAKMLDMVNIPQPLVDQNGRMIRNSILDEEASTAIGDALVMAVERLRWSGAKSNVIILLSDGEQNTGAASCDEASELAKSLGIRVYTIGIGSTGMAPFPTIGPDGRRGYSNQPVRLDEGTLKKIADVTGGEYFNARDTATLEQVCERIDALEKTIHEERVFTRYREWYRQFLIPGLALILVGVVLRQTKFSLLPE